MPNMEVVPPQEAAALDADPSDGAVQSANNFVRLRLLKRVEAGDELTISYVDTSLPLGERAELLDHWAFECACSRCIVERAASDSSDRVETERKRRKGEARSEHTASAGCERNGLKSQARAAKRACAVLCCTGPWRTVCAPGSANRTRRCTLPRCTSMLA